MKTSYGFIPDNELVTQQMPAFPKEPLNNYINKLIIDKIDKNGFYIECIFNDGKTKILNELTKIEAQYVFNNNLRFKIKGRLSVSLPRCIDPKLAYFVGYFIADGGLIDLNRSYKVSGHYNHKMIVGDEFLLHVSFIADLFENLFGIRCKIRTERIEKGENFYYINPTNKIIYRFLTQLFEMSSGSKTNSVVVPKIILASPIEIQR